MLLKDCGFFEPIPGMGIFPRIDLTSMVICFGTSLAVGCRPPIFIPIAHKQPVLISSCLSIQVGLHGHPNLIPIWAVGHASLYPWPGGMQRIRAISGMGKQSLTHSPQAI